MKHMKPNTTALNSLLATILLASSTMLTAQAQEACPAYEARDVKAQALTEATYNKLSGIYEAIGEELYNEAAADLQKMLNKADSASYERAIILQALGHVESSRERYDQALTYFKESVAIDSLPNLQQFQMMYAIAQLEIMSERYREGLKTLNEWFCKVPPEQIKADAYVLRANAYIELENYQASLQAITKAIEITETPKKNYYQVKLASQYELNRLNDAATTLKTMITYWPEDEALWKQLSSVYLNIKKESDALSVLELAYKRGYLGKKTEIEQLASLYQLKDIPYQAAAVLEKGISDGILESNKKYWERAGNAWYQARELEKALVAYEKAGRFSDDGKLDLRRGFILIDRRDWDAAKTSLARAIEKGGLTDTETGNAWLLIGMSELNQDRYSAAIEAFDKAQHFISSRQAARLWIGQVKERQQAAAS
jgi:tetratricopeptide (TPR) repeat protein